MENNIPQHVAIIMDGNGRGAENRGLPKIAGHRAGAGSVRKVVKASGELGIKILTLYTFSTENWKRPKSEIDALFGLLEEHLKKEEPELIRSGISLRVTGDVDALPSGVRDMLRKVIKSTQDNTDLVLNLALNYGSRAEIIRAVRMIAHDAKSGLVDPDRIDEELFSSCLYTKGLPDPDLFIRTSGERRLSNFLLWQISYSELYITDKLWPDFGAADLKKAVDDYKRRDRRFGG